MTYRVDFARGSKLPAKLMTGEVLLLPKANSDSLVFIYRGQRGNVMKLSKGRWNRATERLETIEDVRVRVRQRKQFSRLMGLAAVQA